MKALNNSFKQLNNNFKKEKCAFNQLGKRFYSSDSDKNNKVQIDRRNRHNHSHSPAKAYWNPWQTPWNLVNRTFEDDFLKDFWRDPLKEWSRPSNDNLSVTKFEDSDWSPSVDVKEDEQSFKIHADLPGLEKANVKVRIEDNNVLCIEGERAEQKEEKDSKKHRIERRFGKFSRRFTLPDSADLNNMKAKFNNGELEVLIAKKEKAAEQAKEIEIE